MLRKVIENLNDGTDMMHELESLAKFSTTTKQSKISSALISTNNLDFEELP